MEEIPPGTKVSADFILRASMAQIWGRVRMGEAFGGLMGEVKAVFVVGTDIFVVRG